MNDEHIKRTYIVEDQWKCPSCGAMNPGRFLKCQSCGAAKGKAEEDVTNAEGPEVTDQKLLDLASGGANWVCAYCGTQDRTTDGRCRNCGAKQEESKQVADAHVLPREHQPPPPQLPPPQQSPPPAAPRKSSHLGLYLVLGILGSCTAGMCVCLAPHESSGKVTSTHWVYSAALEQRQLMHGSGFSVPGDAFNRRCEQRVNGTHDCDPYTCGTHSESYQCRPHDCNCHKVTHSKKNGFSEVSEVCSTCYDSCSRQVSKTCYRQCPTYSTWCAYDYYQWNKLGTRQSSGEGSDTYWPSGVDASGADQRVTRDETYEVTFDVNGKPFTHKPKTLAEYRQFTRGAAWKVKVNAAGSVWPEAPMR